MLNRYIVHLKLISYCGSTVIQHKEKERKRKITKIKEKNEKFKRLQKTY